MFNYITLRNFKSFENITIDFRNRQKKAKPIILLYGPNGIGKSNIVSAFELLSDLFDTMQVRDMLQRMLSDKKFDPKNQELMVKLFHENFKDMEDIIHEYKMIGSTGNMFVEFGFSLNDKDGVYQLETNDKQIIHEHLSYTLVKNKGVYFDFTPEEYNLNRKLFKTKNSYTTILETAKEYWGKHSILSIIMHEIKDKSIEYMEDQLTEKLIDVIYTFKNISCANHGYKKFIDGRVRADSLKNLKHGEIDIEDAEILTRAEQTLNKFFTTLFPSIKKVYYDTCKTESTVTYSLYFLKQIGTKLRDIPYKLESDGTTSLLEMLPLLLNTVDGITSIIDEFDTGLHQVIKYSLLESLQSNIEGQLILTTHDISLMDSKIKKEYIYIVSEDNNYQKYAKCITDTDQQIHINSSRSKQYIDGKYQGLPQEAHIDFVELDNLFHDNN